MFSHIAEETTRLAHGFLGALFGVILLLSPNAFWPVASLCFCLYVAFIVNSGALLLLYRGVVERRTENMLALFPLAILYGLGIAAIITYYLFGLGMTPEISKDIEHIAPVRFGIVVYLVFVVLLNISHIVEILDQGALESRQQPV